MAVDSRATQGNYIGKCSATVCLAVSFSNASRLVHVRFFRSFSVIVASQNVKKIIEINPYLLGTMAGGAADVRVVAQSDKRSLNISFLVFILGTRIG